MEHFYHIFMVPIQNLVYNSSLQLNFTIKSLGKLEVRKKKKNLDIHFSLVQAGP